MCWNALGSYKHSITLLRRARDLLRLCGMSGGPLDDLIMGTQAEVHLLKSEYLEARSIHTQILHNCSIEQNPYQHAGALLNIAQIDVEIGVVGHELGKNLYTASQFFGRVGYSMAITFCDIVQTAMYVNEDILTAKSQFRQSLTLTWGKSAEAVSYCLEKLADVCLWTGTDPISYNASVIFLVHSLKMAKKRDIYKALQFLGDAYLAHGGQQTAMSLWVVALEGFTQMDVHRSKAECMLRLGDLLKLRGDLMKAGKLWKTARPLFERSSQQKQMADIDARLSGIRSELLDGPAKTLIRVSDLNALTASLDELDVGQINITSSNVPAVEIAADRDGSDPVLPSTSLTCSPQNLLSSHPVHIRHPVVTILL
ncbi:hypothetical protein FB451DRAFT_1183067 [Mycena latifolia]|nr:hypothetical protein FB451DRAFT_1183067 [Mycena latifolia]